MNVLMEGYFNIVVCILLYSRTSLRTSTRMSTDFHVNVSLSIHMSISLNIHANIGNNTRIRSSLRISMSAEVHATFAVLAMYTCKAFFHVLVGPSAERS